MSHAQLTGDVSPDTLFVFWGLSCFALKSPQRGRGKKHSSFPSPFEPPPTKQASRGPEGNPPPQSTALWARTLRYWPDLWHLCWCNNRCTCGSTAPGMHHTCWCHLAHKRCDLALGSNGICTHKPTTPGVHHNNVAVGVGAGRCDCKTYRARAAITQHMRQRDGSAVSSHCLHLVITVVLSPESSSG